MSLLVITTSDMWIFVSYFVHVANRHTYYTCGFLDAHVNRSIIWFVLQAMQDYCSCSVRYFLNLLIIYDDLFNISDV